MSALIAAAIICSQCKLEGLKSKVYELGCQSTLLAAQSYYDENGKYHHVDNNITTCNYKCSNGHEFSRELGVGSERK